MLFMKTIRFPSGDYEIIREITRDKVRTVFLARRNAMTYLLYYYPVQSPRLGDLKERLTLAGDELKSLNHQYLPLFIEYAIAQESKENPVVPDNAGGNFFALVQFSREGKYLSDLIAENQPLSLNQWFFYFTDALEILRHIHSKYPPVCHGNISPASVVMAYESVYFTDFGLCRYIISGYDAVTEAHESCRAPEQLPGNALTPAMDLYSLAMTFIAHASLLNKDRRSKNPTIMESIQFLPEFMKTILGEMTSLDPGLRPKSADAVLKRIYKFRPTKKQKARRITGYVSAALFGILLILAGWKYANSLKTNDGEIMTLGGWFSGHGNPVSPVTDMLFDDEDLILHRGDVFDIAFHPSGKQLISIGHKTMIGWDLETRKRFSKTDLHDQEIYTYTRPLYFDYSDGGKQIMIGAPEALHILDAGTFTVLRHYRSYDLSRALYPGKYGNFRAFGTDRSNSILAALFIDSLVTLYNMTADFAIARIPSDYPEICLFSPGGEMFILGNTVYTGKQLQGTMIQLIPTDDPNRCKNISINMYIHKLAISPDLKYLILISGETVYLHEIASGKYRKIMGPEKFYFSEHLAVSPDSRRFAVVSGRRSENYIGVYDIGSGNLITGFSGHQETITNIRFSPDGKKIVSSSYDQTVKLWSIGNQ